MNSSVPSAPDDTSRQAFDYVAPFAGNQRTKVFYALRDLGEATDQQLKAATGLELNSLTPRRGELVTTGHVRHCGRFVHQHGKAPQKIWTLTGLPYDEARASRALAEAREREQTQAASEPESFDPELLALIEAWPKLTPQERAIIVFVRQSRKG